MNLKFRLALLFSLSVFVILLISALSIFLFNENFRKEEFTKYLALEGIERAERFFSIPGPSKSIIDDFNKFIDKSSDKTKFFIFDFQYRLLYSSPGSTAPAIPTTFFTLSQKKEHYFTENERECVLSSGNYKGKKYYVLASGLDIYGHRKSDNLKVLLTASVLGGLLLSGFLAFFYVTHAMKPLEELKRQIEKINEKNLEQRIPVSNEHNEVWEIAKKFNAMLDRLEQAFEQRKNFVRHASHELRTPLANMLSQTESALGKNLSAQEYRQTLVSLKEDQQDLIDLTNSLLTLSRYGKISSGTDWTTIRIDEVLYEVVDFANQMWPTAIVTVDYETMPRNENDLEFQGNESLIRAAVHNLIKNAINYSGDKQVKVGINADARGITLHIDNTGNQLSPEEQNKLFIPFFRGENSVNKKGFGLGLSIVQRIVNVHKGTISYQALGDQKNRFTLYLPAGK
jgi:signal transduction histidine kinase